MSNIFALKTALREFLRNRDDIDKIQPPYGSQFNSRVSQKTSQVIANIISDIDYTFFQVIKDFDSKRRNIFPDAFQPDWIDLLYLVGLIKILSPRKILEMGSGVSTSAIVFSLTKFSSHTKFVSLDDSKEWGYLTEKIVRNQNSIMGQCNYEQIISPIKKYLVEGYETVGYSLYPSDVWDFIYVDGPPLFDADACLDPIRMNSINDQTVILIDGRNYNVKLFSKLLKVSNNSNWKSYRLGFPCDDALFINFKNKNFNNVINFFEGSLNSKI